MTSIKYGLNSQIMCKLYVRNELPACLAKGIKPWDKDFLSLLPLVPCLFGWISKISRDKDKDKWRSYPTISVPGGGQV